MSKNMRVRGSQLWARMEVETHIIFNADPHVELEVFLEGIAHYLRNSPEIIPGDPIVFELETDIDAWRAIIPVGIERKTT